MFAGMGTDTARLDEAWWQRSTELFRARLDEPGEFAAFVIDKPAGGLAAVAVGWLNQHLVAPSAAERVGYVANICTDPDHRRRGYARATLEALLAWLRGTDASVVNLHASGEGEALYRSLGFAEPTHRALTLHLR